VASEPRKASDAPERSEAERVRRLREDARRPMSVNLAEGIALSHKLMSFSGAAGRPRDLVDLEDLEAASGEEQRGGCS
jgi:hypothetical protein